MRQPRASDSNLFAIDHETIKKTLADANEQLLKRRNDLLAAFLRAPEELATDEDIERARLFARQLDETVRETRKARLSDGRPFREAAATVKDYFDQIEKPLQNASRVILKRLTDTAHRNRLNQGTPPITEAPVAVGIDVSGEAIVTSTPQQPTNSVVVKPEIPLAWSVRGFDRSTLNLDALRGFLTDASILAACRKHLAAHGPHKLRGAVYEEIAQPN